MDASQSKDGTWESTPGLYVEPSNPFLDGAERDPFADRNPGKLGRSGSITSYTTHGTYDTWTELQSLQSTDTRKYPRTRARRSSSVSSTSSEASLVAKSTTAQCFHSIRACLASFCELPVVCHIFWPFGWLDQQRMRILRESRLHGWRMGMLFCCCISSIILGCNVTILVLGALRNGGYKNGFAVPLAGTADDMSWWSSAFHIAINAMSTLLLGASNYTMQVLSSPTRREVDRAHALRQWLDIGVLSLRNLSRISISRRALCIIMGLSTIPIHLFYNSAVFYIAADNDYNVILITPDQPTYKYYYDRSGQRDSKTPTPPEDANTYRLLPSPDFRRLYDTSIVSYGDVVLVMDDYTSEINKFSLIGYPDDWPKTRVSWVPNISWPITLHVNRSDVEQMTDTKSTSRNWIDLDTTMRLTRNISTPNVPKFAHVKHAFAKSNLGISSRIQLSRTFMIIVVVCNAVKLLTMIYVIFLKQDDYIVTLGDGAASFLERPDPATEQMCVMTKGEITNEINDPYHEHLKRQNDRFANIVHDSSHSWHKEYSTYSTALNKDRRVGSVFIMVVAGMLLISVIIILSTGQASEAWGSKSTTTFRETDSSTQSTLLNAWLANAPQLILSFCYFAINSECTAMAGAYEWNNLGRYRKPLRVTRSQGQQREKYFLQLPYRWSLPLMVGSGGLHWLLSQSVFIVRIDSYTRTGELVLGKSRSSCGFSGISFVALSFAFFALVGSVSLAGRRKFLVHIPFAASCSLVISAACHPSSDDANAQLRPVKWGVTRERMYGGERHCTISSKGVKKPVVGERYL